MGGQSLEREGWERLITLEGSFTFNLQRQALLSLCREEAAATAAGSKGRSQRPWQKTKKEF